mmetsp:Transcript_24095/g.75513  ORF Transcript_24095/g.75513 Transcript_24095/m.75513 type:complete len:266 (-) Transcript_24095:1192-1989(-)
MPAALYARAVAGTASKSPDTWLKTLLASPFSSLMAPMSMLLEILSRWPRYLSHGPAMEMWSVVHLPRALMRTLASATSLPSNFWKPARSWRRCEAGSTTTVTLEPSAGGAWKVSMPGSKPFSGSSSPKGESNTISWPSEPTRASFSGLKVRSPAMAKAVTISGEATKQCVAGLPSLRAAKLRLNEVMMELGVPLAMSSRRHWPMQGPHELDITVPPASSKIASWPSRAMVARICSEPGEMEKGTLDLIPAASACLATEAARDMSS